MANLTPADITVAVTVFDRGDYLRGAVRSALDQALRAGHRVMVVEDCGPDPQLRHSIEAEFGDRIVYHRNARNRGLFDNWNACIEFCETSWLCILHDDDLLEPTFLDSVIELAAAAPGRALYYGPCHGIDETGRRIAEAPAPADFRWSELDLESWAHYDPVCFPGQLFHRQTALELGGFRARSRYCGDWELWFRLALHAGAAATNRVLASYREHHADGRGTTMVDVSGRKYAYVNMQGKRHVAWLRKRGVQIRFARKARQAEAPMPSRYLLAHAHGFSRRMLRYNAGLLFRSRAPHLSYWLLQLVICCLTWRSLRMVSRVARWMHRSPTLKKTPSPV
ncbi:MAG: glycosyltransferase [Verrucomicrobia bacterium]|nr:glycosyltransferase [Verrucomicrobiota bacterium]